MSKDLNIIKDIKEYCEDCINCENKICILFKKAIKDEKKPIICYFYELKY
jgi:hypothetical protein